MPRAQAAHRARRRRLARPARPPSPRSSSRSRPEVQAPGRRQINDPDGPDRLWRGDIGRQRQRVGPPRFVVAEQARLDLHDGSALAAAPVPLVSTTTARDGPRRRTPCARLAAMTHALRAVLLSGSTCLADVTSSTGVRASRDCAALLTHRLVAKMHHERDQQHDKGQRSPQRAQRGEGQQRDHHVSASSVIRVRARRRARLGRRRRAWLARSAVRPGVLRRRWVRWQRLECCASSCEDERPDLLRKLRQLRLFLLRQDAHRVVKALD